MEKLDALAIFAHPDDSELSVGGTLLSLKSKGYRTGILDITRGEMGTRGTPEIRKQEALDAAKILGVDVRSNLSLPDGNVFDSQDSRVKLVRELRRLSPQIVFTHQIDDPHPDHDRISKLVRESTRLASMKNFDSEAGLGRIAVPRVAHSVFSRRVVPSFIVDISDFMEEKMNAIRAYKSQFYNPNSTEPETRLTNKAFLDELENRTRYFGSLILAKGGEPFFVREALNIDDPIALLTRSMNLYS